MGRETDVALSLGMADQFLDDPDSRAIAADVRMRGELENAALLVSRIEFALENVENSFRRGMWAQCADSGVSRPPILE